MNMDISLDNKKYQKYNHSYLKPNKTYLDAVRQLYQAYIQHLTIANRLKSRIQKDERVWGLTRVNGKKLGQWRYTDDPIPSTQIATGDNPPKSKYNIKRERPRTGARIQQDLNDRIVSNFLK